MKALITGATSGIGKSIARSLSRRGWELILTGRNEEALKELQQELGNTEIISADLSKKEDVFRVYEFCREKNVDMLVNNAGFGDTGVFDRTSLEKDIMMINTNVVAVHTLMKLYLGEMKSKMMAELKKAIRGNMKRRKQNQLRLPC